MSSLVKNLEAIRQDVLGLHRLRWEAQLNGLTDFGDRYFTYLIKLEMDKYRKIEEEGKQKSLPGWVEAICQEFVDL